MTTRTHGHAAPHQPADAAIGRASKACPEAAGAPATIGNAVATFAERYVLHNRCPADDRLKES
jgi:hypothetical protein